MTQHTSKASDGFMLNNPICTHYIYALVDPRTGEPHYVGRTSNPKRRLSHHTDNNGMTTWQKGDWIRELKEQGLKPVMKILEVIDIPIEELQEIARQRGYYGEWDYDYYLASTDTYDNYGPVAYALTWIVSAREQYWGEKLVPEYWDYTLRQQWLDSRRSQEAGGEEYPEPYLVRADLPGSVAR